MEKWYVDQLNDVYENKILPTLLAKDVGSMSKLEIKKMIKQYQDNDAMLDILLKALPLAEE